MGKHFSYHRQPCNGKHLWINIVVRFNWWFGNSQTFFFSLQSLTYIILNFKLLCFWVWLIYMLVLKPKPSQAIVFFNWDIKILSFIWISQQVFFLFQQKLAKNRGNNSKLELESQFQFWLVKWPKNKSFSFSVVSFPQL